MQESENNGMSKEERDSIVDDLLNEYRSKNYENQELNISQSQIDSIIDSHSNSNYFANLQNVSYDAYCIDDIDQNSQNDENNEFLDWIDKLQISPSPQSQPKHLIYNNNLFEFKILISYKGGGGGLQIQNFKFKMPIFEILDFVFV